MNTSMKAWTSVLALLTTVGTLGVTNALADDDNNDPPRTVGRTLLNRQNGTTRTGLGGVKSQPARPISRLGGVKAQLPRPIGNRGSLLPPRDNVQSSPLPPRRGGGGSRGGSTDADGRGPDGIPSDGTDRLRLGLDSQSGFSASGEFGDDSSGVRFRLYPGGVGSVYNPRNRHRHDHDGDHDHDHGHGHGNRYPLYPYYPWSFGYGYYDYYRRYDDYPPQTIVSSPVYVDPSLLGMQSQQQPSQPSTPPTTLDLADSAMYDGRVDQAIAGYREHLAKMPEDTEAMRRLAIALILDKKIKEGVAILSVAYEKDVSLVRKPLDMNMIPDGERRFRDMLYQVVPFANSMRSASGYLAVAVIMQAEGRDDVALKNLKKAREAGLNSTLLTEFETELGG